MDPVATPYRPGAGTAPPALTGRDQLLAEFRITCERALGGKPDKSVMPTGLRGVGKTVLLNRFVEEARALGFVTTAGLIEASEGDNFSGVLAARLRSVLLQLDSMTGKAKRAIGRALGVLGSFQYAFPNEMGSLQLGVDRIPGQADSGNLRDDMTDLLVACAEAAQERGKGLLIAIDEIQYLSVDELRALIMAVHRTTQLNLPLVLVGAGLPSLLAHAGEAKSYSERLFTFPRIGKLAPHDAKAAISKPALEQGVTFQPEALDELYRVTEAYPFFIQEWAYETWNYAPDPTITFSDVTAVRSFVEAKLDRDFFNVRLERLTPKEKKYMLAMAELGAGPHRSGDIAAKYGAKVERVAPLRLSLIKKGMIWSPAYGDTAFTVPLFAEFLRRAFQNSAARRLWNQ